jgi:hypothetical protein
MLPAGFEQLRVFEEALGCLPESIDALSFYYENRDELDQKMIQDQEFIKQLKEKFPSKMV